MAAEAAVTRRTSTTSTTTSRSDGTLGDQVARLDARFDRLDAKLYAVEARMDRGFAEVDDAVEARMARGFAEVDARLAQADVRFEHLDAKIDAVELKLAGKIATLQWMFGVIVALNATVVIQLLLPQ